MIFRSYSELNRLPSFAERYEYLKLNGNVGEDTFGFDRYINQKFYTSKEWRDIRDFVIVRDNGCDLGIEGYELYDRIFIHHMNVISVEDFKLNSNKLLTPEYLISTSHQTHNAIHYGSFELVAKPPIVRMKNDTCPWKH